jgi:hypothetical protein
MWTNAIFLSKFHSLPVILVTCSFLHLQTLSNWTFLLYISKFDMWIPHPSREDFTSSTAHSTENITAEVLQANTSWTPSVRDKEFFLLFTKNHFYKIKLYYQTGWRAIIQEQRRTVCTLQCFGSHLDVSVLISYVSWKVFSDTIQQPVQCDVAPPLLQVTQFLRAH